MKRFYFFLFVLLCVLYANNSLGQVFFSEPFDEAASSDAGFDNTSRVNWSATCSICLGGDYWQVQ